MEPQLEWNEQVKEEVLKCLLQQRPNTPPTACVTELVQYLNSLGVELPCPELGELLVSEICFHNNLPSMWKLIHHALSTRLLFPLQILALLSSKVIPHRHVHPHAYALFLPLLAQHAFSFHPTASLHCNLKIVKSIDSAVRFSEAYKIRDLELGHVFVLFFYNVIVALIDCTLVDWGFHVAFSENSCLVCSSGGDDMEIDHNVEKRGFKKSEFHEQIRKRNSFTALEVLERLTESRKATVLLQSVLLNMYCLPLCVENFSSLFYC